MVLLILTLELVLSGIGAAIAAIASFAVWALPYALAALPLYLIYRGVRAVRPRISAAWRRRFPKPMSGTGARSRPPAKRSARPAPLRIRAEAVPALPPAAAKPPLPRLYGEGLDILKRQMRGALRRGEIPWFLAFGVGGPALLATDPTHVRWPEEGNGESGAWWFCEAAAVLHAGADSADGSKLDEAWPALVAAMRKRPMRRPLDGILLMVGADELRAAAEREAARAALVRRAAALRARLGTLRDGLGFVCPIHVVVVRAEALDGFADACAGMPAALLDGVLGWTSPHDWTSPFDPRHVDEALDSVLADLALLEADALAAGTAGVRLPLLPASLAALRHPLAHFLDGVLGTAAEAAAGAEEEEPFPLRGIALTGAYAPAGGGRRPAFARDLLPGRAFAEPGYGRPSDAAYGLARRRRRQAQGALAASVVGLSMAAWQGVAGVAGGVPVVAAAVGDLRKGILSREGVADAPAVGRILAATALVEGHDLATPLLPTSLLGGFDEDKRRLAAVALRRAVLRPIRDALLPSATLSDLPPVANPHRLEDLPSYRRLTGQLERIADRRDALDRYERFRRSSGFDELEKLAASVFGPFARPPVPASDAFIVRIAGGADLPNLDAKAIATAVRAESVRLAAPLAEELYARNPLRVRAAALAERLHGLADPPSADDAAEVRRLVDAVTEAAGWPIAAALRTPALGLPDAVKVALQRAALAELPGRETTERIAEALSAAAVAARADLLALEAPPVGALFAQPVDGGPPVLVPAVGALSDSLAAAAPPVAAPPPVPPPPDPLPARPSAPSPSPVAPPLPPPVAAAPTPSPTPPPTPPPNPPSSLTPSPVAPPVPPMPVVAALPPAKPSSAPPPVAVVTEAPVETPALPDRGVPAEAAGAVVTKLAASFSQTLAGRFPFVRPDLVRGAPDADPEDVRRFYRLIDEARVKLGRDAAPELRVFLDQMDAARPMLDAVARPSGVTVELAYGVNRAAEVGAEHIIDWSARSGSSAVGAGVPGARLAWKAGQPVLLSFRWAAGSPFRPKSAAADAAGIAGDTLTVVERGPWALLRLLKGRSARTGSEDGALLRLVLPTQTIAGTPARDTILFIAASVKAGTATALRLPDLPVKFPQ